MISIVVSSIFKPSSDVMYSPPVKYWISSIICFFYHQMFVSPFKHTLRLPLNLFTTSVPRSSPSTSSANKKFFILTRYLFNKVRISFIEVSLPSYNKMYGFFNNKPFYQYLLQNVMIRYLYQIIPSTSSRSLNTF